MSYVVAAALLLIVIGIFTLDLIKIGIGVLVVVIAFLVFRARNNKATKDPELFELLVSITNLTQEMDKEFDRKNISLYSNSKYKLIVTLMYLGIINSAAKRYEVKGERFENLFFAAFNSITFHYKKDEIENLFKLNNQISKYKLAEGIRSVGGNVYNIKLFNRDDYLELMLISIDVFYNDPQLPSSLNELYN